ncbi:GabT 4-aminobutyrate aminotransferase and related aminotransferases [Candidatus Nanopelagicaceae bacterium]
MHGQIPLVWDRAENFSIFDHFGNKWIDFTSTIFVANVGHSNPRVLEAIQETITKPILACYAYPNSIRADYLENLLKFAGPSFEKAFLLSAGTETTEAAMKLMKLHGKKSGKKKNLVVSITGNWHGRTLGAQVLSSNPSQREWITNPNSETIQIAFPYPETMNKSPEEFLEDSLDELAEQGIDISEDVCGFLLETFQGWGAYFYPTNYVKKIREICDKNEILLAFDEMQSGFGRTGLNFGYEHYGVKADLLCCGKGMGGGLPLSGVIGSANVMDLPEVGNMSSTHSGNPLLCAVGSAVLEELINKNLVKNSSVNGNVLHYELNKLMERFPEDIQQINGKGLIAAIIFSEKYKQAQYAERVSEITEKCFQKGLLVVHTGRESIKIGPPLTITQEAIVEGVNVILEAMQEVLG